MSILIFVIILLVLVIVHECGHFFSAKKFGIRVDEFGFGFPPKLFGIKRGETEYTFNLLPIGGFVKIFGEDPNEENTSGPDASRSFVNKAKWKQAIVLVAGVCANFLLAWLLFSFGFMSGLPTSVGSGINEAELSDVRLVVVSVTPESPAALGGLEPGDSIVAVTHDHAPYEALHAANGLSPDSVKSFILEHPEDEILVSYTRGQDERVYTATMTPKEENGEPMIGIGMDQVGTAKLPILKAFYEGAKLTLSVTKATILGLFGLIKEAIMGRGSFDAVTGPVGLVSIVGDAYQFGFVYILSFAALISINLGVINLVPFPALDGGRLFFLLIEKIKGSPLNPKVMNMANLVGFCLLILLMIVVTYHDIVKLF